MDAPALTVLMPVRAHNREFLSAAIGSLHAQSSGRWRLLVIRDGRDTRFFARRHRALLTDPRIELIPNEGRRLAGALNTGMRHARNEFVSVLFGDDLWEPNAVEVLEHAIATHPEADFFHSGRRFVDERGRRLSGVYPAGRTVTPDDFPLGSPVHHLLCWRVSTALACGGLDEGLGPVAVDDLDFPWTMAEHGAVFVPLDECLYVARDHREFFRLTTHLPLRMHVRSYERILRKHGASPALIRERVEEARASYMRQCLYASPLDRALARLMRRDPRAGFRESYSAD